MERAKHSAGGPGVLLVTATGLAAAAVALDAGFDLPAGLRVILFVAWAVAVGVLGWGSLGRPSVRIRETWIAGVAAVIAFGLLVVLVPGGVRVCRLAPPWTTLPSRVRLTITTGEPVVSRGCGVTLACAYEQSVSESISVQLEVRDNSGVVRSYHCDEPVPGVLSVRLPAILGPLTYRFVGEGAATGWYRITPTDPVELAADTVLVAHPPEYATGQYGTKRFLRGMIPSCLVGGRVEAVLVLNRPAREVLAWWQPDDDESNRSVPVKLSPDHCTATLLVQINSSGRLALVLTSEQSLQTEYILSINAVADQQPLFTAINGFEAGQWAVRQGEGLSLSVEVSDDQWAKTPTLELLLGPTIEAATAHRVELTAIGGGRFTGQFTAAINDRQVARLRLRDRVHTDGIVFPAESWVEFTPMECAESVAEQIVVAQMDRVTRALTAAQVAPVSIRGELIRNVAASIQHVPELDPLAAELHATARTSHPDVIAKLGTARKLNQLLGADRLDRLRLRSLSATARRLSGQHPTDADLIRLHDRLAAIVATSTRLSVARATAEKQTMTDALIESDRLADDLDDAASRLSAARIAQLCPLADRAEELAARLDAAERGWATTSWLTKTNWQSKQLLWRSHQLIRDGHPAESLPVLSTVSRRLTELSVGLAHATDARCDPREAARQLVRWRADLDARPGPPPAAELKAWHNLAGELAVLARRHHPTGGDTPERIAREFPTPAELKRRTASVLREWLTTDTLTRPSAELIAIADQLDAMPPPVECRYTRLAAAVARQVVADRAKGRTADATAGLIELRWRLELFTSQLGGDNHPLAVLDESPGQRNSDRISTLAIRIGVPPDDEIYTDRLKTVIRERLDGADTDRHRLEAVLQWWKSRTAYDTGHVRILLTLLDTIRLGDANAAEVRQLVHSGRRSAELKTEVATMLDRLRDGMGASADLPLARSADLDRPTFAQRLIDYNTGGRLPDRCQAEAVRRLAGEINDLSQSVAVASAMIQSAPQSKLIQRELAGRFDWLDGVFLKPAVPSEINKHWHAIRREWSAAGDPSETLRGTAFTLRQLSCLGGLSQSYDPTELARGRLLIAAEDALAIKQSVSESVRVQRLRTAAVAIERAAD